MYTYKTEILTVGTKWLSDKADANDVAMLDNLINERAAELVTYDYMATSMQIKGAFVVTFRKEKDDKTWNGLE
jgi:ferritin-like protein